jgi:hypothetical protein
MRTLFLFSCVVMLAAAGCGHADCAEFGKTWCARVKACGGTPTADCEAVATNLCAQASPGGCKASVDASECVSSANSESCDQVLAERLSCSLRCK